MSLKEQSESMGKRQHIDVFTLVSCLLARDESGQNLVEYGLIVGLIGLAVIVSTTGMGSQLRAAFNTMGSVLANCV